MSCTTGAIDLIIMIVKTIAFVYSMVSLASIWSLVYLSTLCYIFKNYTWHRIKYEWDSIATVFKLRREVSQIINSFVAATAEEITNQGICTICQQNFHMVRGIERSDIKMIKQVGEMDQIVLQVKRTPCGHSYHISILLLSSISSLVHANQILVPGG